MVKLPFGMKGPGKVGTRKMNRNNNSSSAMPTVPRNQAKSSVKDGKRKDRTNRYFKKMDNPSMSTPAGRGFCEQVFKAGSPVGNVYLPSDIQAVISGSSADFKGNIVGGQVAVFEKDILLIKGGNVAAMVIACDTTGFSNMSDILYTNNTGLWSLDVLPNAAAAGLSEQSSLPESIFDAQAGPEELKAVVLGQTATVTANHDASTSRGGDVICGWLPHNATTTGGAAYSFDELRGLIGQTVYDSSILTEKDRIEVIRPPQAYCVNNTLAGNVSNYIAGTAGFMYIMCHSDNASTSWTVTIKTTVFYCGAKMGPEVIPVFSTAAYECAMSCYLKVFGRTASYYVRDKGRKVREVFKHEELQSAMTQPISFTDQIIGGLKRVGSWALKELMPIIL